MLKKEGSHAESLIQEDTQLEVPGSALIMVMITVFVDNLAASISTPVVPYYAKAFHVKTENIGWLYGAWSLTSTVFAPCLGRVADRWGRRPVLIMSLMGAGVANVIQGVALNFGDMGFYIFLFGRSFSGAWAAVGSTCNVYVADVCPPSVRATWLARMATLPVMAILFGPGLGGGLSKFGINVPVMVDGIATLCSMCLVAYYLPETPAFLRSKVSAAEPGAEKVEAAPIPKIVHLLGFANFLGGFGFSILISTFALFMMARYNLDALHVGFCFTGSALVMVATNVWGFPFMSKRLTLAKTQALGHFVGAAAYIVFAFTTNLYLSLFFYFFTAVSASLRMASGSGLNAQFTETSNRGSVFGLISVYTNFGRMIGPIAGTHLAAMDVGYPFLLAGVLFTLAGITTLFLERAIQTPEKEKSVELRKQKTGFGEEWHDEIGSKEDIESLGRFTAELLTKKHYQWVSRRSEIEGLLDKVLPELQIMDREHYWESIRALETATAHNSVN